MMTETFSFKAACSPLYGDNNLARAVWKSRSNSSQPHQIGVQSTISLTSTTPTIKGTDFDAGQHYNHIHFWKWMKAGGGADKIPGNLEEKIVSDLGSVTNMKEDFIQAGITQLGSGWCWLAVKGGKIVVVNTANGASPPVQGAQPILGCDVWEHSYYIDYRNRRSTVQHRFARF
jgi:superoxide dismutase